MLLTTTPTMKVRSTTMPEEITAPAQEHAAPAPQATKTAAVKIMVSSTPVKPSKKPFDKKAIKDMIAKENQRYSNILTDNQYKPEAVVAIMRYMRTNRGYGRPSESRGDLIRIFRNFSERLLYRTDSFDRSMSSQIPLTFISTIAKINGCKNLFEMSDDESCDYVTKALRASWPTQSEIRKSDIDKLHAAVLFAINPTRPESFAKRAKYFFEAVIDIAMNMVDPFDGMIHSERLEMPQEMKDRIEAARQKKAPKADCPMCGRPMIYKFKIQKHFCENPDCSNYSPPPPPRNKGSRGDRSERPRGQYDSGKPVEQVSQTDKFNGRFAKFHKKDKQAPVKVAEPKTIATCKPSDGKGFSNNAFADALSGFNLGS